MMAITKFLTIAYRNLIRNRRRTILTALVVALGLVVAMSFSALLEGMLVTMLADNIRVNTGHLQIRNVNYEVDKASLLYQDLLQDGETLATQIEDLAEVQSTAPVLWNGGLLSTSQESLGVEIVGINPDDAFHAPIRAGITAGEYLKPDDRGRILVGQRLAKEMGITVGQRVSVAARDANGQGQENIFTVAGLVDTGFPGIDQNRVILPLAQAQSFSGVGNRVSGIIVMLHNQEDATKMVAKMQGPEIQVLTWEDLNSLLLQSWEVGIVYYYVLYGIVFLVVAALIANTLLMSVFERAREIGILASLGMNRGRILLLFLLEGIILGLLGIVVGWVLGLGAVSYLTFVGIPIPAETVSLVEGFAFGTTMYGGFAPDQFVILSLMLLAIVALVSLYPAWYAARMEPVEALHAV
ncbi:MAG: ABC transporter permease [Anaerolineae bacterium]|nr:ABC transporter permease [Anaerolineae bacterium]